MCRFQVPDLKPGGHMMDVRTADGSVVKISAGNEQDLAKTLGVEMVQNMYKVENNSAFYITLSFLTHNYKIYSLLFRLMLKILISF